MVMRAPDPPTSKLPRITFHWKCLFGHHRPDAYSLHAVGEKWHTFIYTCMRCNRVVGESHAVKDYEPRV